MVSFTIKVNTVYARRCQVKSDEAAAENARNRVVLYVACNCYAALHILYTYGLLQNCNLTGYGYINAIPLLYIRNSFLGTFAYTYYTLARDYFPVMIAGRQNFISKYLYLVLYLVPYCFYHLGQPVYGPRRQRKLHDTM